MTLSSLSRTNVWLLTSVAACTLCTVAACDGPARDPVPHVTPQWANGGRLLETFSIGGDGGKSPLAGVGSVYASREEVYVADTRAPAVRVYSRTGEYLRQVGREGQGPGEYLHPNGVIGTLEETVVMDPSGGNARLQFFDREGRYLRQVLVPSNVVGGGVFFRDSRGNIYLRVGANRETDDGGRDLFWGYALVTPNGSVAEPVFMKRAHSPGTEAWQMRLPDGKPLGAVPYAPEAHWAVGPDGVVVDGVSSEYRLTISHPSRLDTIVVRDVPRVQVTAGERAYREAVMTAAVRRFYPNWTWDGPEIPDDKPAFSRIKVAQTGEIWVIRQGPGEVVECPPEILKSNWSGTCWEDRLFADVYTPTGVLLGEVRLPTEVGDLEIAFLSSDFILARAEEPSGNHSVRGYVLIH